jgi:dethiobiotin synthetase
MAIYGDIWLLLETAGGAFSPLSSRTTNRDLATILEPAIWVLVASDSLGVLHDVRATLTALDAVGRRPDFLVLSQARDADSSTGTNERELRRVGLPKPIAYASRGADSSALEPLARALLRLANARRDAQDSKRPRSSRSRRPPTRSAKPGV